MCPHLFAVLQLKHEVTKNNKNNNFPTIEAAPEGSIKPCVRIIAIFNVKLLAAWSQYLNAHSVNYCFTIWRMLCVIGSGVPEPAFDWRLLFLIRANFLLAQNLTVHFDQSVLVSSCFAWFKENPRQSWSSCTHTASSLSHHQDMQLIDRSAKVKAVALWHQMQQRSCLTLNWSHENKEYWEKM